MNDPINAHLMAPREHRVHPRVICADGMSVSIQASSYSYCHPRLDYGPWRAVELGFPSERPSDEIMEYAESPDDPTGTVYGYVPIELVQAWLDAHGGIK